MELTEREKSFIARLPLPANQRALVERYWEQETNVTFPGVLSQTVSRVGLVLVVAILAAPLYAPTLARLSNLALLTTWVYLGLVVLNCFVAIGLVVSCSVSSDRKMREIMFGRYLIRFFAEDPAPVRAFWTIFWISLFVTCGLLGHFLTGLLVLGTFFLDLIAERVVREKLPEQLAHLVATEPGPKNITPVTRRDEPGA